MEGPTGTKIQRKKPSMSINDGTTQNNENTLDSNTYLSYDILRLIFQHLDAKSLMSAAMVCTSWLEAANKEKSTRSNPSCFTICCEDEFSYDLYHVQNIMKPSVGFFFVPDMHYITCIIEELFIKALLPKQCEIIILNSEDIIDEIKNFLKISNMVCAFLPQISNVRLKLFDLSEYNENDLIQETVEFEEIISTINNETSTCLMLFYDSFLSGITASHCVSAIQQCKKNKVLSIWGGKVKRIQHAFTELHGAYPEHTQMKLFNSLITCCAVLITGPIQTWSTILEWNCCIREQVEKRLKLFKDKVKLKKHSVGFMFRTRSDKYKYDDSNVDSIIFKRLFPTVPLVGCLGEHDDCHDDKIFVNPTTVDEMKEEILENNREEQVCNLCKFGCETSHFSSQLLILTYD
ncbi:PREDICTED: uncharacterized protein LOC105456741 [Wasmannia auropunctata]|uniref:uncharacterized protein LOC105456741 n=1 Tax=Wasmannia auropunctata TaxID=64793 RepID=UPI0005F022A6|nr:PREDICTED: uncharacterized protein LOC105456741 [Wasmannia auropunctata]